MLKPLALAFAVSATAGACVPVDDGYYYEPAAITARWSFADVATDTATGCPEGFDSVIVKNQMIDDRGPFGPVYQDLFDCSDEIGTALLDPAVYETWIEVTDRNQTKVFAQSLSAVLDVIAFDAEFEAEIVNDGGYFGLSWDLVGADSNRTLDCRDLRADTVEVTATTEAGAETFSLPCADHIGVTDALLAGAYSVTVEVRADGERVLTSEPVTLSQTIQDRNRVTDLGHLQLPIAGH